MRYISTAIGYFRKIDDDKQIIKILKDGGFTAYDFGMCSKAGLAMVEADDYLERARELRAYADSIGIVCNQSHAPFPSAIPGDEAFNADMQKKLCRAIEISGVLGAKICVVHPCHEYTAEENAEMYRGLVETAKRANVKVACENLWSWVENPTAERIAAKAACSHHDDFVKHMQLLKAIDKDVFVACVDIGHAQMNGLGTSAAEMIEALGDCVGCIHLHDTDCVHDNHHIPFACSIDYEPVIAALRKIGYQGDVTLETDYFHGNLPKELLPASAAYAAAVASYFKMRLEK